MAIRSMTLSLAITAASFVAGNGVLDEARADARIIRLNSSDKPSYNGRIVRPSSKIDLTSGGRILHVVVKQDTEDAPVKYITPRYPKLDPDFLKWLHPETQPNSPADHASHLNYDHSAAASNVHRIAKSKRVNVFIRNACYSGGSLSFRAGDKFQAGGNMLRVPSEEAAFGRRVCAKTRIFQRYLGFKRVYKGQVYTGFRKVYSGRKYLNGSY